MRAWQSTANYEASPRCIRKTTQQLRIWPCYFAAARDFNQQIHRLEQISQSDVRRIAEHAMMALYSYSLPGNWCDGRPHVVIPLQLASDIAHNMLIVLRGRIPRWMSHLSKKGVGAPAGHPKMGRDIGIAVAYKKLCSARSLSDRRPTATIARMYGVSKRRVQQWMKVYDFSEPSLWFPEATDETERARLIQAALPDAAGTISEVGSRSVQSSASRQSPQCEALTALSSPSQVKCCEYLIRLRM